MHWITRNKTIFLAIVAIGGLGIDVGTKWWASTALKVGEPVRIIGDYFSFMLLYNKAAIFGLDPRHVLPWFPLKPFFLVFSVIAVILLIAYYFTLKTNDPLLRAGLAVILPGALGNMHDRVFFSGRGVVDFIKMGLSYEVYWPVYNMADVYITIGVSLILLSMLLEGRKSAQKPPVPVTPSSPASPSNNN